MRLNPSLVLCVVASVAWIAPALAQQAKPDPQQAIPRLIQALADSGCQFNRNGAWYDSAKAARHLQRKYDYIQGRGQVASTEQFIELAGTQSSLSGKPYQVRCGSAPAQPSRQWLLERLRQLRANT